MLPDERLDNGEGLTRTRSTHNPCATERIDEEIERKLADQVENGKKVFEIRVSPILGAYLSRGLFSFVSKWKRKLKCKVKLTEVSDYSILQYEILDENGKVLD